MRSLIVLSLCLSTALAFAPSRAEEELPWFDMEKCGICSHMLVEEGMLEHMTWNHYPFAAGMFTVTTVAPDYAAAYKTACAKMEEAGEKLAKGDEMYLCGHCSSHGHLMMGGAKAESFQTEAGELTTFSSTDPEVIARIHAHVEKTKAAMAEMEAGSSAE